MPTMNSKDLEKAALAELDNSTAREWVDAPVYIARAQVYATLAVAAAVKETD